MNVQAPTTTPELLDEYVVNIWAEITDFSFFLSSSFINETFLPKLIREDMTVSVVSRQY